jgi:hypothetical protein
MQRHLWPPSFLIHRLVHRTPAAFADADAERDALAKIIHELNALETPDQAAPRPMPIRMPVFVFVMTGCVRT